MFFYQGTGEFPGKLQVHPPHLPNFTADENQECRGRTVYRPGHDKKSIFIGIAVFFTGIL